MQVSTAVVNWYKILIQNSNSNSFIDTNSSTRYGYSPITQDVLTSLGVCCLLTFTPNFQIWSPVKCCLGQHDPLWPISRLNTVRYLVLRPDNSNQLGSFNPLIDTYHMYYICALGDLIVYWLNSTDKQILLIYYLKL
jgi:hypothetical protein